MASTRSKKWSPRARPSGRPLNGKRARLRLALGCAHLALCGCAFNLQHHYQSLRPSLISGDAAAALATVEGGRDRLYGDNNRLLYLMDRAMVLSMAGRAAASNEAIEEAKALAQQLWTTSISQTVESWVGTDNRLAYAGEDFERVMLHLLAALNYLSLGEPAEARVEARQWTARLALYNQAYQDHPNAYADDPFARWLAGRLRAEDDEPGALGDAFIDLRRALDLYRAGEGRAGVPTPRLAIVDAARAAAQLGGDFAEERRGLARDLAAAAAVPARPAGWGSVVFVHLNGEAPYKVDDTTSVFTGQGVLRIAVPRFVARVPATASAIMEAGDGRRAVTETMSNIAQIAVDNLADHLGRIRARAVARAVSKHVAGVAASEVGRQRGGTAGGLLQLGGALWNVGNALAETADTRSWVTLPARLDVCALDLPAGRHLLQVRYLTAGGAVRATASLCAEVRAGATTFLSQRTLP